MNRDHKGYTGLREIGGGVPILGTGLGNPTQAQMHQAITQQIALLSRELFVRAGSDCMRVDSCDSAALQQLARNCHEAAKAYFLGLGVIQETTPEPTDPDSTGPASLTTP